MHDDSNGEFPPHRRGFLATYGVELLFESYPADLEKRLDGADVEVARERGRLAITLRDARSIRGTVSGPRPPEGRELAPSLQQSWWWRDAGETVKTCTHALLVAEAERTLPHLDRYARFQELLERVVRVLEPSALHWFPTQQLIRPADFLGALREAGPRYPALGALNVRLFAVGSGE